MHSNGRRASSRLRSHGDATHRVHHFEYPDSQLTSENETETNFSDLNKERKLRQEAEAQSIRLAGLLEKAVTQFEKSEQVKQPDTETTSTQQKIIQDLSLKANKIEQKLENLKIHESRLATTNQNLSEFENRPTELANGIEDRVLELHNQLERIEEGTNRIAAKNRNIPKRWSSQISLNSAMPTPDFERHKFSLTPDKTSGRVSTLEMELATTRQIKDELRHRLEQMLNYAKSLESELRNNRSDLDAVGANREQMQRELSSERRKVSEITDFLTQEKENARHFESFSKKLQQKVKICQREMQHYKDENEQVVRENMELRSEFEQRMLDKNTEMEAIYREITRENSELKFQLEDERSKMRSVREIQTQMGEKYRCEVEQLSTTKDLLIQEKNIFEQKNKEFETNDKEIENMHEYLRSQQNEIEQLKNDNSAILKATGIEIDLLINSYNSKHKMPQFTSGTLNDIENEPRKWIAEVLAKLKWFQAEMRATQPNDT